MIFNRIMRYFTKHRRCRLTGCLAGWLLVAWLGGWLAAWLSGWLAAGWLAGWLAAGI